MKFVEIRFTPEAKQAWRWLQTWLIAVLSCAPLAYEAFGQLQDLIPPMWFRAGMALLGFLTIVNMVRRKT